MSAVCLQAGVDLITGFVHYRITEKNNSEEFIEFLKMLDNQYPKKNKIKNYFRQFKGSFICSHNAVP